MSDLIERQAAIDVISLGKEILSRVLDDIDVVGTDREKYSWGLGLIESNIKDIEELPSAQPEQRWIPVSERLPEYMEPVLTWDGVTYCVEKRIRCIRDEEGDPIEGDWWVSDEYDDIESDYYPDLRDGAAIAWMPLPEPYRAERRTDG